MTRPTRLVLLGSPVAHSLSPLFQNAALESAGLPLRYGALDVAPAALAPTLDALVRDGAAGNVTVPHKEATFARCDVCTPVAERVRAVNTFWSEGGRLHGDNTDVGGVTHALRLLAGGRPLPASVTIIGAGGAAAAACVAAEEWGATDVRILSRSPGRARALASRFQRIARVCDDATESLRGAELVINATPLGLRDDDPMPTVMGRLPSGAWVLDLVYRREETEWVRRARSWGHTAADGLAMLLEQGALSFERWFGVAPDREAMARALREQLGRDR